MSDLEKMSLVELRVAGRKMGVKNVTTYKKRELLELLLEVEKKQSSNVAESAVDNAENASADVKIKKTENRKKEEKKDDIPAAEHDNVAEQAGTAESDLKNSDKIENADEKRPQFQNSYVRNDYNEEHKNTYKNRREGGIQSSYGRTGNVRGQQRNNGRMNQRQGNNPYLNQNPGYSQNGYQSNSNLAVIRIIITRITVSQTADIHRMVITTAIRMAVTIKTVVTVRMAVTDRTITAR